MSFSLLTNVTLENADISYVTNFNPGKGTYAQIVDLEREGQTFAGVTTLNAQFPDSYGKPVNFADPTDVYTQYILGYRKAIQGANKPVGVDNHFGTIIIAVSEGGAEPEGVLDTVLGF